MRGGKEAKTYIVYSTREWFTRFPEKGIKLLTTSIKKQMNNYRILLSLRVFLSLALRSDTLTTGGLGGLSFLKCIFKFKI